MFKRVLIAEDHESVSISVQKSLADLGIVHDHKDYVYYCDDALNRIQKAVNDNQPYDLLVTDLSFEEDVPQNIKDGVSLIKSVREIQPSLKVLVFSIENRFVVANKLIKELNINAFVPKARHDAKDLKLAIEAIIAGKTYCSPNLKQADSASKSHAFTKYDQILISLLAQGMPQKDIPFYLQKNDITPAGLSSVEKRLSLVKEALGFTKNEQLIAYCKDRDLI